MSEPIHRAARVGFARAADRYARGRPDYPTALLERLRVLLPLTVDTHVVDLGAGTGKLTALLAESTARVTTVEPIAEMRARIGGGVLAVHGRAEAMPLADASADAVVVGQAFHWFDGKAALREIARVTKPHAKLALIWNQRDESVPWIRELTAILEPYRDDTPRFQTGAWRAAFDDDPHGPFGPLVEEHFAHVQRGGVELLLDRVHSISFIASLDPVERARIEARVRALVKEAAEVVIPYVTYLFWAQKRTLESPGDGG